MAFVPPKDRVLETSTSNSQTVFAVTGAADASYNRFSAHMSVGDTTIGAVVEPGLAFKSGKLTYSATNEITIDSTGFESKGTFSSGGTKEVFMGLPAKSALMVDGPQSFTAIQQNQAQHNAGIPAIMRSYLAGLTLSTAGSSATFGVGAGVATDKTNIDVMSLSSAYTKTTSSWAVGSGNGALDTGSVAINTWYHVFIIKRPDTGVVDIILSTSATAPSFPANYTLCRRIGAMKTNGSSQWIMFIQYGDEFLWSVSPHDVSVTNLGTSAVIYPLSVPTQQIVFARIRAAMTDVTNANATIVLSSTAESDQNPSSPGNGPAGLINPTVGGWSAGEFTIRTDSAQQIRARSNDTCSLSIYTMGWIDRRDKDV